MTRDKILEATALEIERNGLTQFRIKRVASEAGISAALLYSYFENREDLIAATMVHRYRQVLLGLVEIFTTPLKGVTTTDGLRTAMEQMIAEAQHQERTEARILRIDGMAFARHNGTASAGMAAARHEASVRIMEHVKPLVELNLLAEGMSGVAFARIWYALFFGQIALEGEHELSINAEDWLTSQYVLANAMIRCEAPILALK